jgi:integrase
LIFGDDPVMTQEAKMEATKAKKKTMKFTKEAIEALQPTPGKNRRENYYDETQPSLAVRVSPTGQKVFYVYYRLKDRGRLTPSQAYCLGSFPTTTVQQARNEAIILVGKVKAGEDPAKERKDKKEAVKVAEAAKTVAAAWDEFYAVHSPNIKPHTKAQYEGIARLYIIPELGKMKIDEVTSRDITKLYRTMKDKPYMANRFVAVLSVFFNWCEDEDIDYRPANTNPTRSVKSKKKKYEEKKKTDFLTDEQLAAIGPALSALEKSGEVSPLPAAALRLLIFTGMRVMEVLTLKWEYLDLENGLARLPDSKTGAKVVPLSGPAVDVLRNLPRFSDYVFPSDLSKSKHLEGLRTPWISLCAKAELKDRWRIHDLRHAFASMMVNSGRSLEIIGKVLGHSQPTTTARYAHVGQSPAQEAANLAATKIAESWNTEAPQAPAPAEIPQAEAATRH